MKSRSITVILLVLIPGVIFFACQSRNKLSASTGERPKSALPPANDDFFQEIISYSGIDFIRTIGDEHLSNLVESDGGGAAFLDYDQDWYLDQNLSMNEEHPPVTTSENRLYRNRYDGTFEDVTDKAGVGDRGYSMGITVGDYDNDGYMDIVVTEVMDTRQMELVCKYADIIQIGSRSMHNFPLLKEAGKCRKPVLFKRGLMATIDEYLHAAEYILKEGNQEVILCERGIRTFEKYTRNTLDLSAVPILKRLTHLPVIVDPSHATGHRWLVPVMAKAAIIVGADGIMVEVHNNPLEALSDGQQSLFPEEFDQLMKEIEIITEVTGRKVYRRNHSIARPSL